MKPITCLLAVTVALALVACGNGEDATVQAQVDCADWNTIDFFNAAVGSDVVLCLQSGSDPNARGILGFTPLHWAAVLFGAPVIEALLEAGANPNAQSEDGSTPLHSADTAEVVAALLLAGADIDAENNLGETPLHRALLSDAAEAVTALLDLGADHAARSRLGTTPLHYAQAGAAVMTLLDLAACRTNTESKT